MHVRAKYALMAVSIIILLWGYYTFSSSCSYMCNTHKAETSSEAVEMSHIGSTKCRIERGFKCFCTSVTNGETKTTHQQNNIAKEHTGLEVGKKIWEPEKQLWKEKGLWT